ncbi:MAG: RNA polymerase sigma factor [Acidimicrobiales bacterium]
MGNDQAAPAGRRGAESVTELVDAARRSDALAWQRLVTRFDGLVRNVARRYGLNNADVADVTQTVWLRLFEHLHQVRDPARLGGWLATTTRNESLRLLRRREVSYPADDGSMLDGPDERADPQSVATKGAVNDVLVQLVEALPGHHRKMARLLMVDPPLSYSEISVTLGIPMGSIGPTRQRCIAQLRTSVTAAGLGRDVLGP